MEGSRGVRGKGGLVVVVAILSGLAALVVAAFVAFFIGWHCTSGDGGAPFVAADSAQATVCEVTGDGVWLTVALLILALALIPIAVRLGRGWASGAAAAAPFVAVALLIAALPAGTLVVFAPFSAACSDDQLATVEEWERDGARGSPPFDCASY